MRKELKVTSTGQRVFNGKKNDVALRVRRSFHQNVFNLNLGRQSVSPFVVEKQLFVCSFALVNEEEVPVEVVKHLYLLRIAAHLKHLRLQPQVHELGHPVFPCVTLRSLCFNQLS